MRVPKSETRELADQEIAKRAETADWSMSNSSFFIAFVVIVGLLAVVALLLTR